MQAHMAQQGVLYGVCVQLVAVQLPKGAVARTEVWGHPAELLDADVLGQQAVHAQHQAGMVNVMPI